MYILAFESTGAHASVAIADENGIIGEIRDEGTLNHLERLIPMAKQLLEEENINIDDISYIAVSKGPGSFTGIRIGVTTARALAQNLGIKAVAVPTLEAFCYAMENTADIICPVFDARRNQIYAGAFQWKDGTIKDVVPAGPYMIDEYLEMLKDVSSKCVFFGDGIRKFGEKMLETVEESSFAPQEIREQSASNAAIYALSHLDDSVTFDRIHPEYMRQAEAERKREERLQNERA